MSDADIAAAWDAVHKNSPEDWYVGRPYFDERHNRWEQYAYDPSEKPSSASGRGSGPRSPRPSCGVCRRWRGAWAS